MYKSNENSLKYKIKKVELLSFKKEFEEAFGISLKDRTTSNISIEKNTLINNSYTNSF